AGQGGGIHLVLFEGPPEDDEIRAESPPYWLSDLTRQQADPTAPAATPDEGPGLSGLPLLDYAVHEKILVADGKQAVVGGRNLEDRYFSRWLDVDLFLEGPVVAQVCQGFSGSFSQAAGWAGHQRRTGEACPETGAAGDSRAAFVRSRPWEGDFSTMTALALAVSCSRDRIWCGSQYVILPRGVLADALKDAAQRGVDVRIFTNSLETTSQVAMGAAWLASVPYLDELLKAGVRIFELKARPDPDAPQPYYHAKEFLFDGRVLAVGSHNLSLRSAYVESENLVFVGDETLCAQREEAFLRLVGQRARELTLERLAGIREEYKGRISLAKKIELLF
ncbi:MAG: phosphatidylserine/phosphatidylglycerophosphate/cardiolipin synthase family protein, partial [Pseudomonadota bacterium]